MKYIYFFLIAAISHHTILGQTTGSIRGTIKTSDGSPAEFVNVSIEGTSKGAVAGRNGNYEIKNVAAGNYVLIASFVGLENQRQQVSVKAGASDGS